MTEFSITPDERAGIEKAAQWHQAQAKRWLAAHDNANGLDEYDSGVLMFAGWHRAAATQLRRLLEPRSSAPEGPDWSKMRGPITCPQCGDTVFVAAAK